MMEVDVNDIVIIENGDIGRVVFFTHQDGKIAVETGYTAIDGFRHIRMWPLEVIIKVIK